MQVSMANLRTASSRLFIFLVGMTSLCPAGNLSAPYSLETSLVLPSGLRNPRFINLWMSLDTRYDDFGGKEPLGNRFNKAISWNDVLESQDDDSQRKLIRSVLKDNALPMEGGPGTATGLVNVSTNVKIPVFAIGLTDKWMVAVAVPIVKIDLSIDTGFVRSEAGKKFISEVCDTSPEKCNEAARKLNDATRQKLSRLGYQRLESHTVSGLGDIQIQSKFQLSGDSETGLTSKLALTLPTGGGPNPDRALDITTGDNRFKLGAMLIFDQIVLENVRLNIHGGYTALLPGRMIKRLPTSEDDLLSKDKELLTRKWGDLVTVGSSLECPIQALGLSLGGGYTFQYLSATRYDGSKTDPNTQKRYWLLSDLEPSQTLHSLILSAKFSSVDWYRRKKFFLPFQTSLIFSRPIAGQNAPANNVIAGEMVLFF